MKHDYAVARILDHFPGLKAHHIVARLKLSTFVNVRKRYFYFAVGKAACTQMKYVLRSIEGAAGPIELFADESITETRRDMFVHARANVPLPSLVELDDSTQREVLESPDFLRMTIVRNPYSRLISAWRGKVLLCESPGRSVYLRVKGRLPDIHEKLLVSFEEFVQYVESESDSQDWDPHWARQVDYTLFPVMNFSFVGKVERLNESLRRLESHLGLSESLTADGRNESLPIGAASYTQDLADRVYSLYQTDFAVLGYDRNSWTEVGRGSHSQDSAKSVISEERLRDEIMERNLTILGLYQERRLMKSQLRLLALNGKVALREKRKQLQAQLRRLLGASRAASRQ